MNKNHLESDIGYVREVVGRAERGGSPGSIYLLWAAICLVGFSLYDFAPQRAGLFWMIAGPAGAVISGVIGYRHGRSRGQMQRDVGIRHGLHWIGMMAAIALVVPLGATGVVAWTHLSKIILLIVALGYVLAGVHLDRPLLWVGVLMAAGYVGLLFISTYAWTILGVLVAVGLVAASVFKGKQDVGGEG